MSKRATSCIMACILVIIPILLGSCGKEESKQYDFDYRIKELKTVIEPQEVSVETVLMPPWGSSEGQIAHNPDYPDLPENAGPSRFCVDSEGRTYIDDYFNERVVLFDENGGYIRSYPYPPGDNIGSVRPEGMAATGDGLLYWATLGGKIFCYNKEGNIFSQGDINEPPEGWPSGERYEWKILYKDIEDIMLDSDGNIYFPYNSKQIEKDNEGGVIKCNKEGKGTDLIALIDIPEGTLVSNPIIDSNGNIYITCYEDEDRISLYVNNQQGRMINSINVDTAGKSYGLLGIDTIGNLYVRSSYEDPLTGSFTPEFFKYDSKGNLIARYRIEASEGYRGGFGSQISFRDDGSIYSMYCPINEKEGNLTVYRIQL